MWSCSSSASKASEESVERGDPPGDESTAIVIFK
jgi:hypothetical protein